MKIELPALLKFTFPQAYIVGGAVRDFLRGLKPHDFDLAVACNPLVFAQNLHAHLGGRLITIGKRRFTVYRLLTQGNCIDVTPLKGPTIESDLQSRDFTINALACETESGILIDITGGLQDLGLKTVRMVGENSFSQDPARLMRAFRLAAGLGFTIDPNTQSAIANHAPLIRKVAAERIWSEMKTLLENSSSSAYLQQMVRCNLLTAFLPEFARLENCSQNQHHSMNVLDHTIASIRGAEILLARKPRFLPDSAVAFIQSMSTRHKSLLKMALLLHDLGKPDKRSVDASGRIRFTGHAEHGAVLAEAVCLRLRLSNRDRDWIVAMVRNHQRPLNLFLQGNSSRARGAFFRAYTDIMPFMLIHSMADELGKSAAGDSIRPDLASFFKDLFEYYVDTIEPLNGAPPLLNGLDLMSEFNLTPSPLLGELLRDIEEARMAGTISNRNQALARARQALLRSKNSDKPNRGNSTPP